MRNTLFYGDNLAILREYIPNESVDLVYLDPPFNSNRSYNVLFRHEAAAKPPTNSSAPAPTSGRCTDRHVARGRHRSALHNTDQDSSRGS
jgi:DNA modification methylase